jgi:hypothetical protein
MGRRALRRKDLEKVYAEDPGFRDVKTVLAAAT